MPTKLVKEARAGGQQPSTAARIMRSARTVKQRMNCHQLSKRPHWQGAPLQLPDDCAPFSFGRCHPGGAACCSVVRHRPGAGTREGTRRPGAVHLRHRHRTADQGHAGGGRPGASLRHGVSRCAHDPRDRACRPSARHQGRQALAEARVGGAGAAGRVAALEQRTRPPALRGTASRSSLRTGWCI